MAKQRESRHIQELATIPAARSLVESKVQAAANAYLDLVELLGSVDTKVIWDAIPTTDKGRPSRSSSHKKDDELLQLYDAKCVITPPSRWGSLPREIAESLPCSGEVSFGNSASAIERKIRRLLKAREKGKHAGFARAAIKSLAQLPEKWFPKVTPAVIDAQSITASESRRRQSINARLKDVCDQWEDHNSTSSPSSEE